MRCLNIGGANFKDRTSGWEVLEYTATDYNHNKAFIDYDINLRYCERLPICDNCFDVVYTSHTLEHIGSEALCRVMAEIYRIMVSGGILRIQVPDAEKYWEKAKDGNKDAIRELITCTATEFENNQEMLEKVSLDIDKMEMAPLLDKYSNITTEEGTSYHGHLNWFSFDKLNRILSEHGFTDIRKCKPQGSELPEMRGPMFDRLIPELSVFAESRKRTVN